jgi:hypothetical protein
VIRSNQAVRTSTSLLVVHRDSIPSDQAVRTTVRTSVRFRVHQWGSLRAKASSLHDSEILAINVPMNIL